MSVEREVITREFKVLPPVDGEENVVRGYASIFDVVDSGGDMVHRGAFRKTLKERLKKGLIKLMDSHEWTCGGVVGTVTEAKEDDTGLQFTAQFASTDDAQNLRQKAIEGHINQVSFGYDAKKFDYTVEDGDTKERKQVRHLRELKLYEISLVPFGMNEQAYVSGVKAAVPYQDLPITTEDMNWDSGTARRRIKEWATADGEVDMAKYRKGFLWHEHGAAQNIAAYRFPVADVIDGKIQIVPRALYAAAGEIMGTHGGKTLSDADVTVVKTHLTRYYDRLNSEPPWKSDAKAAMVGWIAECVYDIESGKEISQNEFDELRLHIAHLSDVLVKANVTQPDSEAVEDTVGTSSLMPPSVIRAKAHRAENQERRVQEAIGK